MKVDKYGRARRVISLTPARWQALKAAVEEAAFRARSLAIVTRAAHVEDESHEANRKAWQEAYSRDAAIHAVLSVIREAINRKEK